MFKEILKLLEAKRVKGYNFKQAQAIAKKIKKTNKEWVYGTRSEKWYLVGPDDEDYKIFSISNDVFKRIKDEKKAIAMATGAHFIK